MKPRETAWLRLKGAYLPYVLMLILICVLAGRVAADLHLYRFVQVF